MAIWKQPTGFLKGAIHRHYRSPARRRHRDHRHRPRGGSRSWNQAPSNGARSPSSELRRRRQLIRHRKPASRRLVVNHPEPGSCFAAARGPGPVKPKYRGPTSPGVSRGASGRVRPHRTPEADLAPIRWSNGPFWQFPRRSVALLWRERLARAWRRTAGASKPLLCSKLVLPGTKIQGGRRRLGRLHALVIAFFHYCRHHGMGRNLPKIPRNFLSIPSQHLPGVFLRMFALMLRHSLLLPIRLAIDNAASFAAREA